MAPDFTCAKNQGMLADGTCRSCISPYYPNGCSIDTPYCNSFDSKIISCGICPEGLLIMDDNACVYKCEEGDTNPIMDAVKGYCLKNCVPGYYYDNYTGKCVTIP